MHVECAIFLVEDPLHCSADRFRTDPRTGLFVPNVMFIRHAFVARKEKKARTVVYSGNSDGRKPYALGRKRMRTHQVAAYFVSDRAG